MKPIIMTIIATSLVFANACKTNSSNQPNEVLLRNNWKISSADEVHVSGEVISTDGYNSANWIEAYVPSTVMGILSALPEYENILDAVNYYAADQSKFDTAWWYRTEFDLEQVNNTFLLQFDGLSYYANIWLNGQLIASRDSVFGTFRRFEFNVSNAVVKGKNVLAVEVFRQREGDFGLGFVDWNPRPLDENMGIWRDVRVKQIDKVQLKNSFVRSKVNTQTLNEAWLTVGTTLKNHSNNAIHGEIELEFENQKYRVAVELAANEEKEVLMTPKMVNALHVEEPRLWWSNGLGEPELYNISLAFFSKGKKCDFENINFGIREIESYFNESGQRGFKLNGKEILIKGAGWTDDIFLRDTPQSNETQVQYVKHMGLNTIRFETIWGTDRNIYELCDRYGILAMVGWSCQWEWENYLGKACDEFGGIVTPADMKLVLDYTRDQVIWLRNHPSIFVWLTGSDMLPRPELEKQYIELFNTIDNRPWLGAASKRESELTGPTGVKMHGPYEYVGSGYWYIDKQYGGAYGFNTETGPGPQLPVKETITKMLPAEKLWPLNPAWDQYCTTSAQAMNSVELLSQIVTQMWGAPKSLDDFIIKSHLVNYEAMRAMFEAFRVNRPASTGIIQWMLNSAWPSFYWQLYDYYLVPTPAYYAAKKALEPVQLHFDYGNRSIVLSNESLADVEGAKAIVSVFDSWSAKISENEFVVKVAANSSTIVTLLPDFDENVFVKLQLRDKNNLPVADNFYWLSAQNEIYDWANTNWVHTPMKQYGNYKALNQLNEAKLHIDTKFNDKQILVKLTNTSNTIALFNEVKLLNKNNNWIVPAFFSDNYFSILPGEVKEISIDLPDSSRLNAKLFVSGWNLKQGGQMVLISN
ncbi:MAG: beta galactosidase jelly roll domain-containing protein [Prolixibacteraceae bacterium]|nr:beta galactosidase jelly roll domain-containing protein [Prolixibacteraceae bacterium]